MTVCSKRNKAYLRFRAPWKAKPLAAPRESAREWSTQQQHKARVKLHAPMFGVLCRILLYGSLALETHNVITLEITTPAAVAPDGVVFCITDGRFAFTRDNVSIISIMEGGSIWDLNETEILNTAAAAATPADGRITAWLQTKWNVEPVEVGIAADVLGTDPYYGQSYTSMR